MADRTVAYAPPERRHPRLVRRTAWLRQHAALVLAVAMGLISVVFVLDAAVDPPFMLSGFYLVPLTLLALTGRERWVMLVGLLCLGLSLGVMQAQGALVAGNAFNVVYGGIAGIALVLLAYLIRRLSTISEYATLRAQLSEAGADILAGGSGPDDLDELLEFSLERLGEQLDAVGGAMLVLDEGRWRGRAGFGLGVDAREVGADEDDVPLAGEALAGEEAVVRDLHGRGDDELGPLAGLLRLERVLVVPLRALETRVGVLVFDRPLQSGEFDGEQISLAEGMGRYIAVAIENVRLMRELSRRRHDLELVRDSSLDFAESLDIDDVLRAVVARLVSGLAMDVCEVYEVDEEHETLRLLVSWESDHFETDAAGHEFPIDYYASSNLAVTTRRPVYIVDPLDPRLNEVERDEFIARRYRTQLGIPLRIGDRVLALVELFDSHRLREFSDEEIDLARTICRFAALAVDKARLFDRLSVTAQRRDRLARRLQRLQSFAVDLNRRLDLAQPEEVLEEVASAALDLVHVRAAAVVSGAGEYLACRALKVDPAGGREADAVEHDLLERCHVVLDEPAIEGLVRHAPPGRLTRSDGMLLAPLESESPQLAGTLVVADKVNGDAFDREDELLVATLAAQLAASLHNVTAYQREHAIARTFQEALLMEPPVIPGIEVGVCYRAATEAERVGGDFYDLVMLSPTRLMITLGDVCGKSLAAAAESAVVRYMLRAYAAESSPGEALARLNSALIEQMPNQPFVTLVVAYVDVARHMFEFAVAGHPRPLTMAGHGEFPVSGDGHMPVGIFRGAPYPTNRAVLPDDSCIVLFTDGFTEARRDGVMFGEQRLKEAALAAVDLPAQELADHLLETVTDYAGGVLADDCAVVVVKLP